MGFGGNGRDLKDLDMNFEGIRPCLPNHAIMKIWIYLDIVRRVIQKVPRYLEDILVDNIPSHSYLR